jgi:hypothetical protein
MISANFGSTDLRILLKIHCILLTFIQAMQNAQNLQQILLLPLLKFGGKVPNIFCTQPFGLY